MSFRANWKYPATDDPGLRLFTLALDASSLDIPTGAKVLEIGCAEADWMGPALRADRTLQLTGIDWRKCHGSLTNVATIIKGDVLTQKFEPESFDVIVSLSAIEHIGLGHYEHDPVDPDGDTKAMARAWQWLKTGGRMYLDVPYTPEGYQVLGRAGTEARTYNSAAVLNRLLRKPWTRQWCGYAPSSVKALLPARPVTNPTDTGRPYYYVALWLQKV